MCFVACWLDLRCGVVRVNSKQNKEIAMTAKKRKFVMDAVVAAIPLMLVIWIVWGNQALEQNTITINCSRLPERFDGYRIAHVSDLHNAEIGNGNEKLLTMLRDSKPDIIAITGDLIDSRSTDVVTALRFVWEAVKIAPCYVIDITSEYTSSSTKHRNRVRYDITYQYK